MTGQQGSGARGAVARLIGDHLARRAPDALIENIPEVVEELLELTCRERRTVNALDPRERDDATQRLRTADRGERDHDLKYDDHPRRRAQRLEDRVDRRGVVAALLQDGMATLLPGRALLVRHAGQVARAVGC